MFRQRFFIVFNEYTRTEKIITRVCIQLNTVISKCVPGKLNYTVFYLVFFVILLNDTRTYIIYVGRFKKKKKNNC